MTDLARREFRVTAHFARGSMQRRNGSEKHNQRSPYRTKHAESSMPLDTMSGDQTGLN